MSSYGELLNSTHSKLLNLCKPDFPSENSSPSNTPSTSTASSVTLRRERVKHGAQSKNIRFVLIQHFINFISRLHVNFFVIGLLASSSRTSSFQSLQNISQGNEKRCYFIKPKTYSTLSPSSREANLETAFFKPGLVIFDKDGTLVCFHAMWTPWCKGLANRMKQETER